VVLKATGQNIVGVREIADCLTHAPADLAFLAFLSTQFLDMLESKDGNVIHAMMGRAAASFRDRAVEAIKNRHAQQKQEDDTQEWTWKGRTRVGLHIAAGIVEALPLTEEAP
jgi:hypothetical protein